LRGETNEIRPETIWMSKAEIAKSLVQKDPSLLLPANKETLLNQIDDRDRAIAAAALDFLGVESRTVP
jgi:hypothetical protein